jgi:hypothetical protein
MSAALSDKRNIDTYNGGHDHLTLQVPDESDTKSPQALYRVPPPVTLFRSLMLTHNNVFSANNNTTDIVHRDRADICLILSRGEGRIGHVTSVSSVYLRTLSIF